MPTGNSTSNRTNAAYTRPGASFQSSHTQFIYFAAKFGRLAQHPRRRDPEIPESWTAISKPPYFTALALWPHGSTWGGGGLFLDDVHFWNCDWHDLHPRFSLGPLCPVSSETAGVGFDEMWKGERKTFRLIRDGWQVVERRRKRAVRLVKSHRRRKHKLVMDLSAKTPSFELLVDTSEVPAQAFAAEWADLDQSGRLVVARDGKLWAGAFSRHKPLHFKELADFNGDRPEPRAAPAWALVP